ncbi:MAG: hypothetical protein RLY43_1869 [Bacteroidota bacterium]|jgi:hypothetical protein
MSNPFEKFKSTNSSEYESFILENVHNLEITDLTNISGLKVMNGAVKLFGVRINVNYNLALKLCSILEYRLPTALEVDTIYLNSTVLINPQPQPINSNINGMIYHSEAIDKALNNKIGLVSNEGKFWISPAKEDRANLYGWGIFTESFSWRGIRLYYSKSKSPRLRVIQPETQLAHNRFHSDYSMTVRFVKS